MRAVRRSLLERASSPGEVGAEVGAHALQLRPIALRQGEALAGAGLVRLDIDRGRAEDQLLRGFGDFVVIGIAARGDPAAP